MKRIVASVVLMAVAVAGFAQDGDGRLPGFDVDGSVPLDAMNLEDLLDTLRTSPLSLEWWSQTQMDTYARWDVETGEFLDVVTTPAGTAPEGELSNGAKKLLDKGRILLENANTVVHLVAGLICESDYRPSSMTFQAYFGVGAGGAITVEVDISEVCKTYRSLTTAGARQPSEDG